MDPLHVAELKSVLTEKGLSTAGNKKDLVARLQEAMAGVDNVEEENGVEAEVLEAIDEAEVSEVKDDSAVDGLLGESSLEESALTEEELTLESPKEKVAITEVKTLSAEERVAQRAKRFGLESEEAKKMARAERFGIEYKPKSGGTTLTKGKPVNTDVSKLQQRAARFGQVTAPSLSKVEETEKMRKRKERFGGTTGSSSTGDIDEKKRKRAERFGLVS